jgi:tRNA 2-thiouridine synthesizing protein A
MPEVEIPKIGKVNVSRVVDCTGQVCPKPQLEAKKACKEMVEGEIVEMLITNPASIEAVPKIITKSGCSVLGTIKDGNTWKLYFKK